MVVTKKNKGENAKRNIKTLGIKRKILKDYLISNKTLTKYADENSITSRELQYVVKRSNDFLNMESDNSFLENKYFHDDSKYGEIYNFIIEKIKIIRIKGGVVSGKSIKNLALLFKEQNPSCQINITDYFVRRFVKEMMCL